MPPRYQVELANRIRSGRCVGTDYVVTRRPDGLTMVVERFDTKEQALEWLYQRNQQTSTAARKNDDY